jgi:polyamine oxidase
LSRACLFFVLFVSSRHTVRSRFVVVAVPLGVLQGRAKGAAIAFNPPLPDDKLEAIHRLGYGVENKAFLEFDVKQRFWPANQPYVDPLVSRNRVSHNVFSHVSCVRPQLYSSLFANRDVVVTDSVSYHVPDLT